MENHEKDDYSPQKKYTNIPVSGSGNQSSFSKSNLFKQFNFSLPLIRRSCIEVKGWNTQTSINAECPTNQLK
jgi:hypothetical protein